MKIDSLFLNKKNMFFLAEITKCTLQVKKFTHFAAVYG